MIQFTGDHLRPHNGDLIAFPYGRDVKEGAKTQEADTLYDYY